MAYNNTPGEFRGRRDDTKLRAPHELYAYLRNERASEMLRVVEYATRTVKVFLFIVPSCPPPLE